MAEGRERSPRGASRVAAGALPVLAALFLFHLGGWLSRRLGEPALSELRGIPPLVDAVAGPLGAAAPKRLALPGDGPQDRASAPLLRVFGDGAPVPFRRRPTDVAGTLAYYEQSPDGRLELVLRCAASAPCGRVTAFARTARFEAALAAARLARSPSTLLAAALLALAGALWLRAASWRWTRGHALPVAVGAGALLASLPLGPTSWGAAALAAGFALLGAPLFGAAWRRCRAGWSRRSESTRLAAGAAALLVFVFAPLSAVVFPPYLAAPPSASDHAAYLRLAQDPTLLPHALYPLLVASAAGFTTDLQTLSRAAVIVLTSFVMLKLALALCFARELLERAGSSLSLAGAATIACAMFLVAPIANGWQFPVILFGQLSPTIWHSPTAIVSLPFAIAAFWLLGHPAAADRSRRVAGCALLLLSAAAKPNFAMAFLPAIALLALAGRFDRKTALACAALTMPLLAWQYQHWSELGVARVATPGLLSLQPLKVWRLFSPHPLASLLLSLAFPLSVAVLVRRAARFADALVAAWLVTLVALAQFALLAESGERWRHGNYYWGTVPALFILFLVSLCELACARPELRRQAGWRACWAVLGLHLASGVLFYVRSLLGYGYRA